MKQSIKNLKNPKHVKNWQKKSKNWEKSIKSQKITWQKKIDKYFFAEKNALILDLLFEEISIWPELSNPPHIWIQGGGGVPQRAGEGVENRLVIFR